MALLRLWYGEPWASIKRTHALDLCSADLVLCSHSGELLRALYLPPELPLTELVVRASLLLSMTRTWMDRFRRVELGAAAAAHEAQLARFFSLLPEALKACLTTHPRVTGSDASPSELGAVLDALEASRCAHEQEARA